MAKKTRQLNDTAAIQASHPLNDVQKYESRSISTRKIDNGYLTCESSNKDGRYEHTETFSAAPPDMGPEDGGSSMKRAAAYLARTGTT